MPKVYIATPPELRPPEGFAPARMIYRVKGARLYLARGHQSARGGMMAVNTSALTGGAPLSSLVDEIASECEKRAFEGVVLDAGSSAAPLQTMLANTLGQALRAPGIPAFVPEPIGAGAVHASVLIQTALSGGTLERHLRGAVNTFGRERVALEADRILMDFTLPAYTGMGESITPERVAALCGTPFFSESLMTNYFTYQERGARHIVLFDDAASMSAKLALADTLGIGFAFMYLPHIRDLLDDLRPVP
jgi:hypothetical protein